MLRKNHLRELLKANKPSLGTRLFFGLPSQVELVGQAGAFDYVEFLAEYAPFDLHQLDNLARAVELFPNFSAMVKIPQDLRGHLAARALGAGLQNLLFADIRTPQDALECVRAVRPEVPGQDGQRGVGMGRDVGHVLEVGSPFFVQSATESVIALMIEKKEAVENLEAILAVNGVDMVQFGPADYSVSIGLAGQRQNHPAVAEAERYVIQTALKKGIHPRVELREAAGFEPYLELGVRHFNIGLDLRILYAYYQQQGARMRATLDS